MKRFAALAALVGSLVTASLAPSVATAGGPSGAKSGNEGYPETFCQQRSFLCVDPFRSIGANGHYTGHDEPSLLFTSHRHGTGNRLHYVITLPKEPPARPNNAGTGGTWNFNLRAVFWLGLTLCDSQSSPNFRNSCTPDTDRNARYRSFDPASPFYIGKSPGNAFMELQFYPPGWVPQFEGFGCGAHTYCAAMTIDSLSDNPNTGATRNPDCDNFFLAGEEPINWAYITHSGQSQAPAGPLSTSSDPNLTALNPDFSKVLLMHPGDRVSVFMHDTPAGFRIDMNDLTTGKHGSMTASIANGFAQVLFQPHATTCHQRPYAFHPMYDTAVTRGTTWGAHTYNAAFSDEIGHFEYCRKVDLTSPDLACTMPGGKDRTLDPDDVFCLPGSDSSLIHINGCVQGDGDFDGPSYGLNWPGTFKDAARDRRLHPTSVLINSPTSGGRKLEHVAFETDLPRIERGDQPGAIQHCDFHTGQGCTNPPIGAEFYPFFTTGTLPDGSCTWQFGGRFIPGTTRDFGGNSKAAYGHILKVGYPFVNWKPDFRFNDFHRDLVGNPC
jgi:hypothetical protein